MNEAILQGKIDEITKKLSIANDILLKVHTNDTQLDRVAFCICSSLAELDELKKELAERQKYASIGEE